MPSDPKGNISLDFFQWGTLLSTDLGRLKNYVDNYTLNPSGHFGPVNANVVAQFQDHLDNLKRISLAWGAAYQKEAKANSHSENDSPKQTIPEAQPKSSLSQSGETEQPKRRGRPPKNKTEEKRVRSFPRGS